MVKLTILEVKKGILENLEFHLKDSKEFKDIFIAPVVRVMTAEHFSEAMLIDFLKEDAIKYSELGSRYSQTYEFEDGRIYYVSLDNYDKTSIVKSQVSVIRSN